MMAIEAELVRELLSEIVKSKPDIQSIDHKWLIGILKDNYNPKREINHSECNKEINGLANCLFWGIVDDIRQSYSKTLEQSETKSLLRKLVKDYGLTEDLSRWCIESWCIVLNKSVDLNTISNISGIMTNPVPTTSRGNVDKTSQTHSEQLFQQYIYELLQNQQLNLNLELEITIKGKQLGFSDSSIQHYINNTQQKIIEDLRLKQDRKAEQLKVNAEIERVRAQKEAELKQLLDQEFIKKIEIERKLKEAEAIRKNSLNNINRSKSRIQFAVVLVAFIAVTFLVMFTIQTINQNRENKQSYVAVESQQNEDDSKIDIETSQNEPSQKNEIVISKVIEQEKVDPVRIKKGQEWVNKGGWTMHAHDPQRTGRSPFTGPKTNSLKWKIKLKRQVFASPVFDPEGIIYIGSFDVYTFAINPNGQIIWQTKTGDRHGSTPAIGVDGTIYIHSQDDRFFALNSKGKIKWQLSTGDYMALSPTKYLASTILIDVDGTIYFGSNNEFMYAFNQDGSQKWSFNTKGYIKGSQALGYNNEIYISSSTTRGGTLFALDREGKFLWDFVIPMFDLTSPTVGKDGTIYTASNNKNLYALSPNGKLKWSYKCPDEFFEQSAIGVDGTVYIVNLDLNLYAINPIGKLKWKFPIKKIVLNSSPAIDAKGTVYIGSDDNNLYAVNPDGSPKWVFKTKDRISSSPSIGPDGTIYVGSNDGYLYAIGPGNGK